MRIDSNLEECRKSDISVLPKKILFEVVDSDINDGVFEIPNEISEIGRYCFYDCNTMKQIIFSNKTDNILIGEGAFYKTNIEKINFQNNILIGANCFLECNNLKEAYLPNGKFGICAFSGCTSLEKVEIGNNCRELSDALFRNCVSLREINSFENLCFIDESCFENCTSLTSLKIPKSIVRIYPCAFKDCLSLDLVIETSLFIFENFKSTFNVKSLTIYGNEINLDDSIENIKRKIEIIRRKEIDTIVKNIFENSGLNICDIDKSDIEKINKNIEWVLSKFRDENKDYMCSLISFIKKIVEKYSKKLPALNQYLYFSNKPKEEICDMINKYDVNTTFEKIEEIQKYGRELVFLPTYITGKYLDFVRTRNDYNETIIKMKNVIDKLTMHTSKTNLLKKIFLRRSSNGNKLELNDEFINDLNNFIDTNEVNLREELKFLEQIKKILELFLIKTQEQINYVSNYDSKTLSVNCQSLLQNKLYDLNITLCTMKQLSDKIGILGTSNIIIYNKLELLKNTILPKFIMELVINNKIDRNENTINALNSFSKTLEEVIVLNEENKEVLKIDTSDNTKEDENSHSKRKIKN